MTKHHDFTEKSVFSLLWCVFMDLFHTTFWSFAADKGDMTDNPVPFNCMTLWADVFLVAPVPFQSWHFKMTVSE